jgi:hypothetical protein
MIIWGITSEEKKIGKKGLTIRHVFRHVDTETAENDDQFFEIGRKVRQGVPFIGMKGFVGLVHVRWVVPH